MPLDYMSIIELCSVAQECCLSSAMEPNRLTFRDNPFKLEFVVSWMSRGRLRKIDGKKTTKTSEGEKGKMH